MKNTQDDEITALKLLAKTYVLLRTYSLDRINGEELADEHCSKIHQFFSDVLTSGDYQPSEGRTIHSLIEDIAAQE